MACGMLYLAAELYRTRQQGSPNTSVDYQKLYEEEKKKHAEQAANTPPKAEAKIDPWSVAKLEDKELPEGWRLGDVIEATERAEVYKYLSWITPEAEGIEKVRKIVFLGPDDYSVNTFVYQCRSPKVLDKCVQILHEKVLGIQNRFAIDKDNVLIYGLAFKNNFDSRDGEVSPAVETIEDSLRAKFGLAAATRNDRTTLTPSMLPKGWKELRVTTAKKSSELTQLLAGFQPPMKPPARSFRDGWVRSYGDPSNPGSSAEVFSIRFFENDPSKEFTQVLLTYDPAGGQGFVVLRDYDRVVAIFYPLKDDKTPPAVTEYLKHLSASTRTNLDHFDLELKAGEGKRDEKSIKVPLEFRGINSRELRRGGVWTAKVWNPVTKDYEDPIDVQPPVSFEHADGKMTTVLSLPLEGVRVGLHPRDEGGSHLAFRLEWGPEKSLEGKDLEIVVNN
jgi:hypothetical protein